MQNRRDFIKRASLLLASGMVMPNFLYSRNNGISLQTGLSKYIGLQLYSLRDMVKDAGIRKTLETVAQMGYNNLETAAYNDGKIYGLEPAEFKKMVDDLGMKATSAHLGHELSGDYEADMAWWSKAIDAHNTAGFKYMIMPWAPLKGERATLDNIKRYADYFSEIGLKTAASSIRFGYHNHDFEFKGKIDGTPLYDLLMEHTSTDHVCFELDVYWAQKGGYDPVEYMKKYPKRIQLLHIKDETAIGVQNVVDYKAVFEQAYAAGVIKDWYAEIERYDGTPEEDVKKSYDFLAAADFVK